MEKTDLFLDLPNKDRQKVLVEALKVIKQKADDLNTRKANIEKQLNNTVIYQNPDGTWTRFIKTDNIKELEEKGMFYRTNPVNRYTTEIKILKNPPKELEEVKK